MLEYFAYKKYKKHKAEKEAEASNGTQHDPKLKDKDSAPGRQAVTSQGSKERNYHQQLSGSDSDNQAANPVLRPDDESFLESILSNDDPPPPLPPRVPAAELDALSDIDSASIQGSIDKEEHDSKGKTSGKGKGKEPEEKKPSRLSMLFIRPKKASDGLTPEDAVAPREAEREKRDLGNVLGRLNFTAKNNKAISLTNESGELLQRFTQVFKDLVNGVPTAYDDLTGLFDKNDGAISRTFEKLPSSFKKLVTQLPEKITNSLAPELVAVAAEVQGLEMSSSAGKKAAAKKMLAPSNLAKLLSTPGAVAGMLRAIVETLKTRWPAFLGMNVIWTVALSLLLFVLWYCYKRGREERLEREKMAGAVEAGDRIEELPDDPPLPPPRPAMAEIEGVPEAQALAADAARFELPRSPGVLTPAEPVRR